MSYSFYNWQFVRFNFLHSLRPHLSLWQPPLFSKSLSLGIICSLHTTYKCDGTVCVFLWPISRSIMPSKSPSMASSMPRLYSFYDWIMFHCLYEPHFLFSPFDGHLVSSSVLAVVNNAAVNMGVHISFWNSVFLFLFFG